VENLTNNSSNYKDVLISDIRDEIKNSDFPEYELILNYSNCNVRIYQNLTISGNLNLDENIEGVSVIIVEGDLTVNGNIYNDDGVYLYVKGKTTAKNLITGDPVVSLNEVEIDNFIVGIGNDGTFYARSLKTKILINFDLNMICKECDIFLLFDPDFSGENTEALDYFENNFDIIKMIKNGDDEKLSEIMIQTVNEGKFNTNAKKKGNTLLNIVNRLFQR
jgi:hypothetical protein